jgi:NAD(P)-dependent dehydrogenase (short-subunit alcohol dehydrogenase family)
VANKIVLITGVSSGLGRAFAGALLNAGYRVIGTVRKPEAIAEFEAIKPGAAFARVLDVTDEAAILKTVSEIEQEVGPIHGLINNAGYGHEKLSHICLCGSERQCETRFDCGSHRSRCGISEVYETASKARSKNLRLKNCGINSR